MLFSSSYDMGDLIMNDGYLDTLMNYYVDHALHAWSGFQGIVNVTHHAIGFLQGPMSIPIFLICKSYFDAT